jgi:hypothetical protein
MTTPITKGMTMDETTAKLTWAEVWQAVTVTGWTGCWRMTLVLDGGRCEETFSSKARPGPVQREGFLRRCGFGPN